MAAAASRAKSGHAGEYDAQVKLLLIGDSGVGKTCLIMRYVDDKFSPSFLSTIGIDFKSKIVPVAGSRVRVCVWDTAGQERFRTISVSFFRGAHGIALVFDLTDRKSFTNVSAWMKQIVDNADEGVAVILVGNKADMESAQTVSRVEAEELAARFGVPLFLTSAKANTGVSEAFAHLSAEAVKRLMDKPGAAPGGTPGGAPEGAVDVTAAGTAPKASGGCCAR